MSGAAIRTVKKPGFSPKSSKEPGRVAVEAKINPPTSLPAASN
jgi:hypothetical protein